MIHFSDVDREVAREVVDAALEGLGTDGGWLTPSDAEAILDAYGIRRASSRVVSSRERQWSPPNLENPWS